MNSLWDDVKNKTINRHQLFQFSGKKELIKLNVRMSFYLFICNYMLHLQIKFTASCLKQYLMLISNIYWLIWFLAGN